MYIIMAFKICIIGCGNLAFLRHGPSLQKYAAGRNDILLSACCDIDIKCAEDFRNEYGFKNSYTSYREMIETENPDAVCLVVPEGLTAEIAIELLNQKIPVLMEKPPGINEDEAGKIHKAAGDTPHMVAFNRRHMPIVSEIKKIISKMDVMRIKCDFYRNERYDEDFSTTAIHGVDTIKYIADSQYKNVSLKYQNIKDSVKNIYLTAEFENGVTAAIDFCPVSGVHFETITIVGKNETIIADLPSGSESNTTGIISYYKNNELVFKKDGRDIFGDLSEFEFMGFYEENKIFFDSIISGTAPADDVSSCIQSVKIAGLIRDSRERNDYNSEYIDCK